MTSKYKVLPFLVFCAGAVVLSLPVSRRVGHFFVFWKTASQELVPNLEHLQRTTRHLIQHYFQNDLVNLTAGSLHTMESARDLSQRLNLTKFPSERVLNRENRTNFIFIKGLLKENFRLGYAYSKILTQERKFRCNITNVFSLCEKTRDLEKGLRVITSAISEQLEEFFKVKPYNTGTTKRERKILTYFKKKRQTDETEMKHDTEVVIDNEGIDTDTTIASKYKRRNRASVGMLYAVYVHLQDTEGTLQYALRLLKPA